jgi:hypothetical protein
VFSTRNLLSALLALSLSLLAACSSAPQTTDPVDDLAALAGANGDLEATIDIQSVGSSSVQSQAETVHLFLRATHRGKTVQGFSLSTSTPGSGVAAALAAGDRMRIRGRVRQVKGVPAFVGLMQSETAGATAAAVTPPTPVVLVGGNKTLPPAGYLIITLENTLVSGYCSTLRDSEIILIRTNDGKPFASGTFKSATGTKIEGIDGECRVTLNLQGNVLQTPAGPVGQVTGQIKIDGRQPVAIIAVLIGL